MIDQRRRFDRLLASSDSLALLTECFGESVSGLTRGPSAALLFGARSADKAALARTLHEANASQQPFIHVACREVARELSESGDVTQHLPGNFVASRFSTVGLLRAAHTGTLFLENVDDLPAAARDELFLALADEAVYSAAQNRHIPVDVRTIASIDTLFVDHDCDYSLMTFVPLNVFSAYLEFFECYWAADVRTLRTLAKSQPKAPEPHRSPTGRWHEFGSLQQRMHDWMDGWLRDWVGPHFNY